MQDLAPIRRARIDDLPAMQALHARALRSAGCAPEALGALLGLRIAGQIAPVVAGTAWVAMMDGGHVIATAGYVARAEDPATRLLAEVLGPAPEGTGPVGRICGLCVDPAFRGRGLGRRMAAQVEAEMRAAGLGLAEALAIPGTESSWYALGFDDAGQRVLMQPLLGTRFAVRRLVKWLDPAGMAGRRSPAA